MKIAVRDGTETDREFVIDTARRFGAFGPPPWRSAAEVVAGEVRCLDDFFDGHITGPALLVAELDAQRAGFCFLEHTVDYFCGERHGHLGMIAVTDAAEGHGVGGALMRAAEEWARAQGYSRLTLNVFEGNERARGVYERFGYHIETLRCVKMLN
jgi:GNAT superfamily N-acetyltransferase